MFFILHIHMLMGKDNEEANEIEIMESRNFKERVMTLNVPKVIFIFVF